MFVLKQYLFLVSYSYPRASLSENFSRLGTDNVPRKTSNAYQFSRSLNGGSCLYLLNHQLGKMIHVSVAILNLLLAGRKHFSRVLEIK